MRVGQIKRADPLTQSFTSVKFPLLLRKYTCSEAEFVVKDCYVFERVSANLHCGIAIHVAT